MKALAMAHEVDPADAIWQKVGLILPKIKIVNPYEVLVAIYQRPEKTKGNIVLPDKYRDEDIWQGKIGLILSMGELAFTTDKDNHWGKQTPKLNDWVSFRVGDTWQLLLGDQHCRMLLDRHIRFILDAPDVVY